MVRTVYLSFDNNNKTSKTRHFQFLFLSTVTHMTAEQNLLPFNLVSLKHSEGGQRSSMMDITEFWMSLGKPGGLNTKFRHRKPQTSSETWQRTQPLS